MITQLPAIDEATVLRGSLVENLSDEEFFRFCQENDAIRVERTPDHQIIIMPPAGGDSSAASGDTYLTLGLWSRRHGGRSLESSAGFQLADGSMLSPDISWVNPASWAALTPAQRRKFLPLCPDFVVEIKSPSDRIKTLQAKMEQWLRNGVRLGFLIDTETETAYVYRPEQAVEIIEGFDNKLSGGEVLPGFELDLQELRPQS